MDAFDADVLIYAAAPAHPLGNRVLSLFSESGRGEREFAGLGSTLLIPETLIRPTRHGDSGERLALASLLVRLDLRPSDMAIADLAVALGAGYGLKTVDATHLATAVNAGADRFITNNRRDFPKSITEVDVTYPEDLTEPE
ncbi:putative nucleic acid-binding protein [Haloactinopolyspora alba]|uniref:Putative nucleic acid-binding protein n=1 Tax=Haloactinopolyspora alba TaxID=648780 RepID=A0A2P8DFV4_9ACTN|nr:PIN domain-containing protein [Haloactinopolyspora alba]PSK96093.1 putative nucleic acid-binding protein [Haloactinopolyspora alba]